MKGKRYNTEQKIRILRETRADKTIIDTCRERGISEQSFRQNLNFLYNLKNI
ncbi:MAG: hypothetical protein CMI18_06020 [Opitutaceae bacterium]|nr:hypothetical protein [Opitutaceae bacterium]